MRQRVGYQSMSKKIEFQVKAGIALKYYYTRRRHNEKVLFRDYDDGSYHRSFVSIYAQQDDCQQNPKLQKTEQQASPRRHCS